MSATVTTTRHGEREPRGSLRGVLLLAVLFFAPPLLATLLYYHSSWRPGGHTNHGALIDPPRPLSAAMFHGKWSLVYVGDGACDAVCRRSLYFMRQTHWGLGELAPQLRRVFLVRAHCCTERAELARDYPDLLTFDATGTDGAELLAAFPADATSRTLFVVDPRGNLMMRYDAAASPKGLLEDLRQLLRLSSPG